MYKKTASGWLKHLDFIIIDLIVLQIAYIVAYAIRQHNLMMYQIPFYRHLAIVMTVWDLLVLILFNTMHNVMKRGYLKELTASIKHSLIVFAGIMIYMFALQLGDAYSRLVLFLTLVFHIALGYGSRILWKKAVRRIGFFKGMPQSMVAVLKEQYAEPMVQRILDNADMDNTRLMGVVISPNHGQQEICGIPVVSTLEDTSHFICQKYVDSVYLDLPTTDPMVQQFIDECYEMAIPVHFHVPGINREGVQQHVAKLGGSVVVTRSINFMTPGQIILKRIIDIIGGLIGSLFALIIMAIIGPKIKKESPGPILFKQERIGRNGRHFKMIKLRSMYLDADERKAEFLAQNRVQDGMMFKLDFDPRIIGNVEMPDGTRKTGIGDFIRRTSLDEFPQFFNVLKGDMSLVGTRPPTLDEWNKYEFHHRARLSCKPGVTGMWQVSGRSEITDFNEVVKLDTQYITNWSFALDLKIMVKTIGVVFKHKGAI